MALTRVYGRVVYPHGNDTPTPVTGDGVIEYVHATPGIIDGAVHGPDRKRIEYVAGLAEDAWLKPGMWRAYVYPDQGRSYTLHLGIPEGGETTIADAVGEVVPDGLIVKGDPGPPGASVTGGRDNGDGTVSFELSDGSFTDPVVLPPGPAGRGVVSVSDPDQDSRVTITYTDGTTSTVQAIRGAKGDKGDQGDRGADSAVPGPANTLTIGTVTTGATGSAASATITGTAPAQTLNLTLPRGEQGIPGTATLPDTGWRDVTALLDPAPLEGRVLIRRVGIDVKWRIEGLRGTGHMYLPEPSGFATETTGTQWKGALCYVTDAAGAPLSLAAGSAAVNRFISQPRIRFIAETAIWGRGSVTTADPFPVGNLPGTPA